MSQSGSRKSCPELSSILSSSNSASQPVLCLTLLYTSTFPRAFGASETIIWGDALVGQCINCLGFSALYRFISCGGRSFSLTKIRSKINQGQTRGCLILFFTSGGACILAKSYFVFLSRDRRPSGWNFTVLESDLGNFLTPKNGGCPLTQLLSASGGCFNGQNSNDYYCNINWYHYFGIELKQKICVVGTKLQGRFYKYLPCAS